jgi:hypothetical protein
MHFFKIITFVTLAMCAAPAVAQTVIRDADITRGATINVKPGDAVTIDTDPNYQVYYQSRNGELQYKGGVSYIRLAGTTRGPTDVTGPKGMASLDAKGDRRAVKFVSRSSGRGWLVGGSAGDTLQGMPGDVLTGGAGVDKFSYLPKAPIKGKKGYSAYLLPQVTDLKPGETVN